MCSGELNRFQAGFRQVSGMSNEDRRGRRVFFKRAVARGSFDQRCPTPVVSSTLGRNIGHEPTQQPYVPSTPLALPCFRRRLASAPILTFSCFPSALPLHPGFPSEFPLISRWVPQLPSVSRPAPVPRPAQESAARLASEGARERGETLTGCIQ